MLTPPPAIPNQSPKRGSSTHGAERAGVPPAPPARPAWHAQSSADVLAGLMALVVLAPPLADALHLVRPSAAELGFVLALSSLPLWIGQAGKAWSRAREEGARGAARPARTPVERGGGPNPGTD